jgi:O-antigen ligase
LRILRPRLTGADLAVLLLGAAATLLFAYLSVLTSARLSVGTVLVVAIFIAAVIGFLAYPHVAVAATVMLFALVPTLKALVWVDLGAVKDLIVFAAVVAAVILYIFERRRPDRPILLLVLLLLALYFINPGGGHGIAWAQGVRLIGEPLLLLLVGLTLPQPKRTFRFALGALAITACLVAAYGIVQQIVGKYALVYNWGYSFESQVRLLANGQLRSFGTLDDPFAYAALLLFGIAAVFFWLRRGPLAWGAALLLLLGLGFSFVRTAIVIIVALVGLVLRRWGYAASAVLLVSAAIVAGAVVLANASGSQSQALAGSGGTAESANVVLNGRISAWKAALGNDPAEWLLGRGVGTVGTAAARATYTFASSNNTGSAHTQAVDSGYLATIADVGVVGLGVLLAIFARLLTLAASAAREGRTEGWVALGLLVVMLLDALTRASFTGFPTAFLGLLLVGIALAAVQEGPTEPGSATANQG